MIVYDVTLWVKSICLFSLSGIMCSLFTYNCWKCIKPIFYPIFVHGVWVVNSANIFICVGWKRPMTAVYDVNGVLEPWTWIVYSWNCCVKNFFFLTQTLEAVFWIFFSITKTSIETREDWAWATFWAGWTISVTEVEDCRKSVKVLRTHLCEWYYKSVTREFVVVLLWRF